AGLAHAPPAPPVPADRRVAAPARPAEPPAPAPVAPAPPAAPAAAPAPPPLRYLELDGPVQVGDLAARMGVAAGEVVKRLVESGVMAGVHHMIPLGVAAQVITALNFAP